MDNNIRVVTLEMFEDAKNYWLEKLSGELTGLKLFSDFPCPARPLANRFKIAIGKELAKKMLHLSNNNDLLLYVILMTGLKVLFYKYTGQGDIIISALTLRKSNQSYNRWIVLRDFLYPAMTFRDLLMEAKQTVFAGYKRQYYPFHKLMEILDIEDNREISRVALLLESIHGKESIGVEMDGFVNDLIFFFVQKGEELEGEIIFNANFFQAGTVRVLGHCYLHILSQVLTDTSRQIADIELTPMEEKRKILSWFNGPMPDFSMEKTIHQLFKEQVQRTSDYGAVRSDDILITYRLLDRKAGGLAHLLRARGFNRATIAAIMVGPCIDMIIGMLAILKAGGAYLPIDPAYPLDRVVYMLKDSSAGVLLMQDNDNIHRDDGIQAVFKNLPGTAIHYMEGEILEEEGFVHEPDRCHPQDLFYVIYTSGSSGRPKGVLIPYRNFVNLVYFHRELFQVGAGTRMSQVASLSFDAAAFETWPCLLSGGVLYIADSEKRMDTPKMKEWLIKNKIAISFQPTVMAEQLLAEEWPGLVSLRILLTAGDRLKSYPRPGLPFCLYNLYGPTEDTVWTTWSKVEPIDADSARKYPFIGKPVQGKQVYILGAANQLLPVGAVGELCISGLGLAPGYLNQPGLTVEKFCLRRPGGALFEKTAPPGPPRKNFLLKHLPLTTHHSLIYQTGDLARWARDGNIEFLGRIDHQVKIRGFRIELEEIENQLLKHKNIQEVVVIDRETRDGEKYLCAYIVSEKPIDIPDLREYLSGTLPHYMIPSYFVPIERMPRTSSEKIDRKALPVPQAGENKPYTTPRNEKERKLAEIWAGILGLDKDKIDIDENFFQLGGHSLKATRLITGMQNAFHVQVPLAEVFKSPSIRALSTYIENNARGDFTFIPQVEKRSCYPLSYAQQRLWLLSQMEKGIEAYNMPGAYFINGTFNKEAFIGALERLMQRHESLRTSIGVIHGVPHQFIQPSPTLPLEMIDPGEMKDQENTARELIREDTHAPFDFKKSPLWRVKLFRLADRKHLVLFNMHHIISDGWSMGIFISELQHLYHSYVEGREFQLSPLKIQYKDYAAWERRWLTKERLDQLKAFWHHHFGGRIKPLSLPVDKTRPRVKTFRGAHYFFDIDESLTRKSYELMEKYEVTLYVFFLSIFNVFLAKICIEEEIVVASGSAGRDYADLDHIIGFFVRSFAVKNQPLPGKGFADFLKEVMEQHLEIMAHDMYPWEMVIADFAAGQEDRELANVHFVVNPDPGPNCGGMFLETAVPDESHMDFQFAKTDLGLGVMENPDQLRFYFEYNTDLFSRSKIKLLAVWFCRLVRMVTADPGKNIGQYHLIRGNEKELFAYLGVSTNEIEYLLPLTPTQRDVYLFCRKKPEGKEMRLTFYHVIPGNINPGCWEQALKHVHSLWPLLRSTVITRGEDVYLGIGRPDVLPFKTIDLAEGSFSPGDIEERVREITVTTQNLENPLARHYLIRFAPGVFVYVLCIHEIIFDAHSAKILFETLYRLVHQSSPTEKVEGMNPGLYVTYQQDRNFKFDTNAVRSFWRDKFSNVEKLQSDAGVNPRARPMEAHLLIPGGHLGRVGDYCRLTGISLPLYFRGLYGLLIRLYCGVDGDFLVREIIDGRDRQTARLIGCFFQALPQVFNQEVFSGDTLVKHYFQYIRLRKKELLDNQYISVFLQNQLLGEEDLCFYYNYYSYFDKLEVEHENVYMKDIKYFAENEIHLRVGMAEERFRLLLNYNDGFFNGEKLLDRLFYLSRQVTAGAERLGELRFILPGELEEIVQKWSGTPVQYPMDKGIHQLFREAAERNPNYIAVVEDKKESGHLTYRELNKKSDQLAHRLMEKGVQPDTIVGLMADRSIEMVIGILGILKAGGAYLPIDPEYPQERIDYMLSDSNVRILVTAPKFQVKVKAEVEETFRQSRGLPLQYINIDTDLTSAFEPAPSTLTSTGQVSPANLAYIIYTSGTSGRPKGVIIEHGHVVWLMVNDGFPFDFNEKDVWTLFHSFCFDFSVWEMYGALLYGGKLLIVPKNTARDTGRFLFLLRKEAVTVLNQTPTAFYSLMQVELTPGNRDKRLAVRVVILGGEALNPGKLKGWKEKYPSSRLINMFGITETTVHVTFKEITSVEIEASISNIGQPLPGVGIRVLDPNRNPVPIGFTGELYVSGWGVTRGYLNQPEMTADRFEHDLKNYRDYHDGYHRAYRSYKSYLYKTGDLVRVLKNNDMEYRGRIDQQVQVRGYRVELGEIESRLIDINGVKEAVVVSRESLVEDLYLCAYLVMAQEIGVAEIRGILAQRLPSYMIPSFFISIERIPLTPNGKLDRKRLPDPVAQLGNSRTAPGNAVEEKLVEIWSEILGIDRQRIGIDSGFFELGGHSLNAAVLVTRIHREFSVNIPLAEIFRTPLLKEIAALVSKTGQTGFADLDPVEKKEYYVLSSNQRRLWIIQRMEPGDTSYNMPASIVMGHPPEDEWLEASLREILARHENFRTYFKTVREEPVQFIKEAADLLLKKLDISLLPASERTRALEEIFIKEANTPFDLSAAPLVRFVLVKTAEDQFTLVFNMHHIISDGWSMVILKKEFLYIYEDLRGGRESGLKLPRLQYKDFAEWENHQLNYGKMREECHRFWRKKLENQLPHFQLPRDYPGESSSKSGAAYRYFLAHGTRERLRQLAEKHGTSLFMVIFSLFNILLSRVSGQGDIVVGVPVLGRDHSSLHQVVGFFVNTVVLYQHVDLQQSFSDFLHQVKADMLEVLNHQTYPLEKVLDDLEMRFPPIDVFFNMFGDAAGAMEERSGSLEPFHIEDVNDVKFSLVLYVTEYKNGIEINCNFRKFLFKPGTIAGFMKNYSGIIDFFVKNPDKAIGEYKAAGKRRSLRPV